MAKGLLVEHLQSGKIIGYLPVDESNQPGGIVSDMDGLNVVGRLLRGVAHNEWILDASLEHHTGKRYQGDTVLWANKPSNVKS